MHFTRIMLALAGMFIYNTSYERAAQLVLMGVCLDASRKNSFLSSLFYAPFISFAVFGALLEVAHFVHKRTHAASVDMWYHINSLRAQKDLDTLLQLMFEQHSKLWTYREWYKAIEK